jgi:hypothetical protein
MSVLSKLSLAAMTVVAINSTAHAGDSRCDRPPYGGSPDRYRAFLEAYGRKLDNPEKTVEAVCNMKFGGADRTALYALHFSDEEISRKDTSELAVEMLKAAGGQPKPN